MRRRRLLLAGALLLAAVQADAAVQRYRFQHTESRPPAVPVPQFIVADLESELPSSGVRKGDLGYAKDSDKFFKRTASAWTEVGGGSGGAPTGAQYWTGAADATLTAEKDLGALSTGLVLNTAGVPSAYAGTSCTNQFPRSLNASGAATCATVADADVVNTITLDNLTQITTRAISDTTGTLAVARGGTNLTASADDNVMVGNGTTWETKAIDRKSVV